MARPSNTRYLSKKFLLGVSVSTLPLVGCDLLGVDSAALTASPSNSSVTATAEKAALFERARGLGTVAATEGFLRAYPDSALVRSLLTRLLQGQPKGQYAMDLPDADLLPCLLSQLSIPFMPTSGNAFRRAAIGWAFPLPSERRRISADALLIRAAVLAAPIRQIRQVLGEYRVHGQNNYFLSGITGPWKTNRGLRDIAQSGLDLITLTDRTGRAMPFEDRAKLLVAAVRSQLKAEVLAYDPEALFRFQAQVLRLSRGTR